MIRDDHRQFLLDRAHAGDIRHSGRTLFAHLCGTHDLLEQWGNSEPVCAAGLFHSIYGTKHFRHKAWPIADRETIRNLIGDDAERLAYVFCKADRPRAFFDVQMLAGMAEIVRQLREIEAANLLEQGSRSRRLQRLHDSDISAGAKHAIARYLKKEEAA
jgi:(p)ppGpp synthase/HD superfamily hydrolase